MEQKDEFYIGYGNTLGKRTKRLLRRYALVVILLIATVGFAFSFFQKPAANSSFDFDTPTRISGTFFEQPYPMLRMKLAENTFKDILLLGFGKHGANPYLDIIREEEGSLDSKHLTIEGNLIYYNGKTLLQIEEGNKFAIDSSVKPALPTLKTIGEITLQGEIVDPKCYFGVMKPGFGKIHRSCASLCISGGIPPVLVTNDNNSIAEYFLLTDLKGNPIHKDILPYIGQPSSIRGQVVELGNWHILQLDIANIQKLNKNSLIY